MLMRLMLQWVFLMLVTERLTNDFNPLEDPVLTVYNSEGGMVDMNDDKDGPKGVLTSELMITPDEDGVFYISVSAYMGNPGSMNAGDYTVTVDGIGSAVSHSRRDDQWVLA